MLIRKAKDFSFEEVKQGDLVRHVQIAHGHRECTVASCPCRNITYVKVFSKGPWPGLQLRPGVMNGEEKYLGGLGKNTRRGRVELGKIRGEK